jgi:hypothetical protein
MVAELLDSPHITTVGDIVRFTWDNLPILVELDGMEDGHGAVTAELTIANALDPTIIYESGNLNLSAMQTRTTLGNSLKRDVDIGVDWTAVLKQVCMLGKTLYRRGEPSINLAEYELGDAPRWFLEPYLENDGFTIMYADGGTGKSIIALAIAYSVATGRPLLGRLSKPPQPVLYLDWETGPGTQYRRLRALSAGAGRIDMANVHYRYMTSPLVPQAAQIRTEIAEKGIGCVIIDSLGASATGALEDSLTAVSLGRAIRSFRVPTMGIHHKPKNVEGKRGAQVMFGSVYFANYCRLAWELTGTFYEGDKAANIQFVNTKNNNGPCEPRHALTVTFTNDVHRHPLRIDVKPCKISDVPEFDSARPLGQRALDILLAGGPRKIADLAEELDVSQSATRMVMSREKAKHRVLKIPDGRWAAAAVNDNDPPF